MQGMARGGCGLRARIGWNRARLRRQWALTAAALAVGCCGVGSTAGSGLAIGGLRRRCRALEGLKGR